MEHWRDTCILTSNASAIDDNPHRVGSRILQDTSGNVQPYTLKSEVGVENVHPSYHTSTELTATKIHPPTYQQPPPPVLTSNDHYSNLLRLEQRRQRHERKGDFRVGHSRSYLHTKKYLDYRQRQRRDTGADGEPVWSDDVEDAFQDGRFPKSTYLMAIAYSSSPCGNQAHGKTKEVTTWQAKRAERVDC